MMDSMLPPTTKNEEFEAVFKEQFPLVYTFMCHHTSNAADAEDLTADVFARAFKYWDSYSPEKGDRGKWIGGIARNALKTHISKMANVSQPVELSESLPTDDDIEGDYMRRETLQKIFELIDALPSRQHDIMAMKFFEGLTNRDIAEAMDTSVGNVKVVLHRIIKKLKANLRNDG